MAKAKINKEFITNLAVVCILVGLVLFIMNRQRKTQTMENYTEKVKVLGRLMPVGKKVAIIDPICSCNSINADGCYCSDDGKNIKCDSAGVGINETWIVNSDRTLTGQSGKKFQDWNRHNKMYNVKYLDEVRKIIPEKKDNRCWRYSERK